MINDVLPRRAAVWVFVAFASAYFLSTLLRAITATLSPSLTVEFGLHAQDLGLLAGGYFLGFSITQLPMGHWLDQKGPKKVVLSFLGVAVVGCLAFAWATSFTGLLLARVLIGVGVSACLMAPMTGYRRWLTADKQQRANSWMLMTGSLGMLASTLPVQWLLPWMGWRWMFVVLSVLLVLSMWLMHWQVPTWRLPEPVKMADSSLVPKPSGGILASYAEVWENPYFRSLVPMGFFSYGGLVAMQTLWAGPWMVKVSGYTPLEAATGLFWVNVSMLVTFWLWGLLTPHLYVRGLDANRLMTYGVPLNFAVQIYIIASGSDAGALAWALFCMSNSVVALSQPAVGMAFPASLAGRGLSAYNLVLFLGVFVVQWGVGLMVDAFSSQGLAEPLAFRSAISVYLACCVFAYVYFLRHKSDGG